MDIRETEARDAFVADDEVQHLVPVDFGPLLSAARGRPQSSERDDDATGDTQYPDGPATQR